MADARPSASQKSAAQWFGLGLLFVFVAVPAIHWITHVDFDAKADQIRAELETTTSQAEFLQVAESQGMKCETEQGSTVHVKCRFVKQWQVYDLLDYLDWLSEYVMANGQFIDGRKSGDYRVWVSWDGP